ncbi:hypothetical protein [Phenylobacterium sp.]|uniref:hypothetical protein n=1 Tax=Phenylobacterium sp. TaxID=1871053 RepID=UPI0025E0BCE8|nr:hypothetical protein [Phenylobacterium sp.]MBX3482454.1 hypothetical protein [Phenylobacterium sp.]MCW5761253.1 hypothetical protein [Phenylobacterium sp.]
MTHPNGAEGKVGLSALNYPVIGFWKPLKGSGQCGPERFRKFVSPAELCSVSRDELRSGLLRDAELIDTAGHRYRVETVRRMGYQTSSLVRLLLFLVGQAGDVMLRLDLELTNGPPISLAEVQRRVCASIDRYDEEWLEAELENGGASDLASASRSAVMRAHSVAEIFDGLEKLWPS